jgi:carboxylesterase
MAKKFERIDWSEHTKPFFFEGNKIGILLIHGFTGAPGTVKAIGEALNKDGYTVSGIRLPGHGTHIKDMEKASWHDWLKTSRNGALELKERCDKIIVCGLSMGGLLALILASELPVSGVATFAAAMELHDRLSKHAWFLKLFVRFLFRY